MKVSLRARLSISHAAIALLLVAVISVCVNALFHVQFKEYVISQQKQASDSLAALVEKEYNASTGQWNVGAIENVGMNALEQGMILKIQDSAGATVWDATLHNNGMCVQMLQQMAQNMKNRYANFKGGYVQKNHTLTVNGKKVGEAIIGYYGPFYYTANDIGFLDRVNIILLAVGFVALSAALLFGSFISGRISRPVSSAVRAAAEISRGNYRQRIEEPSNTLEIGQLTDAVNQMAGSLERQETLRQQMASDVAHELRTPLASLQSSLEAMIDGVWEASPARLESCHAEILRLGRLVGDLEKLELAEAGLTNLHPEELDLAQLAQQIAHTFASEFQTKKVSLTFEGDELRVWADADKIRQVLVNLLSNALKYTPAGGSVQLRLCDTGQGAEITVADNGPGIPEEDLPFIFERFYRADKSRNRMTGGSGLGLAIVKAIVEAHRGSIVAESAPGKGTVFTVLLPKE